MIDRDRQDSLCAEDVACRRGNRLVFLGLGFRLHPGEALVLTGANGSGKTSLLRLLAGLLPAWRGGVSWNGQAIDQDPDLHHTRVRLVGHLDALKGTLGTLETLCGWAALYRPAATVPGAVGPVRAEPLTGADVASVDVVSADAASAYVDNAEAEAEAALAWFGLGALAEVPVRFLSAGQKRRLALARLLLGAAPLWLLDEPTNALDRAAIARLDAALARHRANGGRVILSTHAEWRPPDSRCLDLDRYQCRGPLDRGPGTGTSLV